MATNAPSGKERYRARFLTELDGRIDAILAAATTLRASELPTLPPEGPDGADTLSAAVDEMYRHAHSIRGAAGTLGIEEAREAADILAEVVLHLSEDGMLGDGPAWDLIFRAAEGLAVFGAACRTGQDTGGTALAAGLPQLRRDFERRFAPPEDAADDFAEVARVLRLTDDEIAAFRFPTQHAQPAQPEPVAPEIAGSVVSDSPIAPSTDALPSPVTATMEGPASALPPTLDEPIGGKSSEVISGPLTDEPSTPATLAAEPGPTESEGARETDPPFQSLPPAEPRMVTIFRESSLRMIEQIPPAMRNLEADRADMVAMRTMRRVFHTIKGDSRQVGLSELGSLCEAAEDVFDTIFEARQQHPDGHYPVPVEALPFLSQAYDTLSDLLRGPLLLADFLPGPARALIQLLVDAARQIREPARSGDQTSAADPAAERRRRLLPTFLAEARHLVDTLHGHIDTLGSDPTNVYALIGSTRALHTLKGNAASMRVEPIARLTHGGESLLERVAATAAPVSPEQLGLLGDLEGAIRHVVDTVDSGEEYDSDALTALLTALTSAPVDAAPAGTVPPPAAEAPRARPGESAPAVHLGEVRFAPRNAVPRASEPVPATTEPSTAPTGESNQAPAGQPKAGAAPRPLFMPRSSSVPERAATPRRSLTGDITSVHLSEVDTAVDLFGRLVTSRTRISRGVQDLQRPATESARNGQRLRGIIDKLAAEFEIVRRERRAASHREGWDALELETFDTYAQIMLELGEIISDQEEIAGTLGEGVRRTSLICESDLETTNDLQRSLLGFRLVRLSTIEPRLDQVITATARAVGRHIEWKLRGGSTAVDKTVLDALQEPLLHLLRNAIDHGIEPPEVREARGKPALGTLGVEASYGTNSLIIRVSDDGGGIDPENIAATAVRRGLLTADAARSLDARAKLDLIWQPGFSTADTVTDISGRGVGLDIVRGAIGRVRGTIALESAVGQGTTFVLTLPLSLSVVRTLVLRDGGATVAAPISQIEGIHLVRAENIATLPDRSVALVDGRTITLLPQGLAQSLPLEERLGGESVMVVEVRLSAERAVGFLIDEVLGEEDTLVKALPRYLAHRAAFVGCGVSDSGRPYAIVDLRRLAEESITTRAGSAAPARVLGFSGMEAAGPAPLVLIVDDSLFMRRSLSDLFVLGGFRVEAAEDGEAALSVIARVGMPNLITLDMEMPRMNGLEMLSILRQLPGGRQVPVFMITTRGQERHRKAALAAGVSRYFIKPFDGDEVLAAAREECRSPAAAHIA